MRVALKFLLGIALTLLAGEGLCRALPVQSGWSNPPVTAEMPVVRYWPHARYVELVGWDLRSAVSGVFNNIGFPGADIDLTKPMLAVIGDSFVEAAVLSQEDRLEERLNARISSLRASSFGISGADLPDYLVTADWTVDALNTQAVVFVISDEDLQNSSVPKRRGYWFERDAKGAFAMKRNVEFKLRNAIIGSRLASYLLYNLKFGPSVVLRDLTGKRPRPRTDAISALNLGMAAHFMQEAAELQRRGVTVLLVFDCDRPAIYRGADDVHFESFQPLAREAARLGLPTIDLAETFVHDYRLNRIPFEYGPNDGHWNPYGVKLVAERIAGVLIDLEVASPRGGT